MVWKKNTAPEKPQMLRNGLPKFKAGVTIDLNT